MEEREGYPLGPATAKREEMAAVKSTRERERLCSLVQQQRERERERLLVCSHAGSGLGVSACGGGRGRPPLVARCKEEGVVGFVSRRDEGGC